ncbi:transient-receptor-potential-like protein [Convolutriloba macropyga]|uniref:transient-receptor-potential-like protein n=1 Tax=Convolutriloba macropyga TaxID=536237 RepID=UPI003F51BF37
MDNQDENAESEKLANLRSEFFKSVESGDINLVSDHLKTLEHIDTVINAEDDFGYTPLALSIKLQSEDLMKLLMQNGADPGDAMLIAVDVGFRTGIKILYNSDRTLVNLAVLSKHFQFGTTPLMVACHNNSYELIEYLFSLGAFPIDEDSSNFGQDGLQRSLYRLSVYKAICSPSYIMITHQDPLHQAFKMRTETHRLSIVDEELSEEYRVLTSKCEKFSEEYLSCVATDKELECLLSMNNPNVDGEVTPPGGPVTRILYAINTNQKKFVAHRFCQQAIDESFTGSIPWRGQNLFIKIGISIIGVLILPFYWILNIFVPPNISWLQWFEVPLLKFASAFVGYLILAIMTAINCINLTSWVPANNEDPSTYSEGAISEFGQWVCNLYVFAWLVGRFFEFVLQAMKLGFSSVWGDTWSRYDILTMLLFLVSTLMYWSGAAGSEDYASLHDVSTQSYEICFSLGTLLVLNRSIYWVGVTESLGKLNILLGFALGIIVRFFLIFFIFQFSFAIAINSLMWKENIIYALECIIQEPVENIEMRTCYVNETLTRTYQCFDNETIINELSDCSATSDATVLLRNYIDTYNCFFDVSGAADNYNPAQCLLLPANLALSDFSCIQNNTLRGQTVLSDYTCMIPNENSTFQTGACCEFYDVRDNKTDTSCNENIVYDFNECYYDIWDSNVKQFTDVVGSLWVTFWALSGSVDYQLINKLYSDNYNVPVIVGLLLWIIYCILGVLIFLNILIGLMFKTMETLEGNVDIDYKCDKAQMLIPFIAGGINPVPPPFNIIPRVAYIVLIVETIRSRILKSKKSGTENTSSKITLSDVKEMLENVKTRWRRNMNSSGSNDNATGEHVKEIESWVRKKMGDLDMNVENCEHFLDQAYKRQ